MTRISRIGFLLSLLLFLLLFLIASMSKGGGKKLREDALCWKFCAHHTLLSARVVEWQTRTFEGRMPKGMGVQVPPRALRFCSLFRSDSTMRTMQLLAI